MSWTEDEYAAWQRLRQEHPGLPQRVPAASERDFQARLRRAALDLGWTYWHDLDSRGNTKGMPDTLLLKPGVLLAMELKKTGGKPTMEQVQWIALLQSVKRVDAGVYWPQDWDVMLAKLSARD